MDAISSGGRGAAQGPSGGFDGVVHIPAGAVGLEVDAQEMPVLSEIPVHEGRVCAVGEAVEESELSLEDLRGTRHAVPGEHGREDAVLAALPGWTCFDMDPSISYWLIPDARLPAIPMAWTVSSGERPRIFAAAAVVPKEAMVPVGWNPLR